MSIHIITTGGTFDKVYYDALSEFSIGEPMAGPLLDEAGVQLEYRITGLIRKDSLDMTDADRQLLADTVSNSLETRILVIHGTDTMTQSAEALPAGLDKTVVFTGAMQPARMRSSDAPFNLGLALGALQCLPAGTYLTMNGRIFNAGQVRKNRAQGRFETL